MFQENTNNLDGRLVWVTAPIFAMSGIALPPFVAKEAGRFSARPHFRSRYEGKGGYLFLYTQSGKGLLKYKDCEYELLPGSMALIDCNGYHEYRTFGKTNGEWDYYWLHFTGDGAQFYSQMIYGDGFALHDFGESPCRVIEDVWKILRHSDPSSLFTICDSIYKLLTLMVDVANADNARKESEMAQTIRYAAEYIKTNYKQPFVLEDVAALFKLSKFYFIKMFTEFTGLTPYRYLLAERINEAKILLRTTDMKVSEVGVAVGIKNESNFSRKFRAMTGMTPNVFRQSLH